MRRYSALAGFVAPGESLEAAVCTGSSRGGGSDRGQARVPDSQPWPFPASLMLGFTVTWRGGDLGGSDPELEDKRWFTREEVADATRENS